LGSMYHDQGDLESVRRLGTALTGYCTVWHRNTIGACRASVRVS
jgi:hypothetical protein